MNEAEWKCDPICGFLLQEATINGGRIVVIRSALGTRQWESVASAVRGVPKHKVLRLGLNPIGPP